jgi:hypothetical protein
VIPLRTIVELNAKVHDRRERVRVLGRVPGLAAKRHKTRTREKMIAGPHTGNLYWRKRGAAFRRFHRASARGQRPSPDTVTLVNAVTDERTGEMTARVFIAERANPSNGALASDYAEILQNHLNRPIMTEQDAKEGQRDQQRLAERAVKKLL